MISNRVNLLTEPETIAMAKKARELIAQGIDVISLSMGEPDFDTPTHVKQAAIKALDENKTHYTPVPGIPEIRQAICHKLKRDNNLDYSPENIVVSTGAKHSLMNTVLSLVNPGDEVILPSPFWVSYEEIVKFAEGKPVLIKGELKNGFKITPEQLEQSITERTKLFIFSNPCNPTGIFYNEKELREFAKVFQKYPKIHVVSDEIYEYINYIEGHYSIAQIPEMFDRTIIVNGVSKGYAMTGWRIGYIAASPEIAAACEKLQGQFTSGANSIAQYATVEALGDYIEPSVKMVKRFGERKDLVLEMSKQISGFKIIPPEGTFYIFPDVSYYFNKKTEQGVEIKDDKGLAEYLLNDAHVAVVPGSAFGDANCIRISFAIKMDQLQEAFERMIVSLNKLK